MNRIEQKIINMYEQKGIGRNSDCQQCRKATAGLSSPVGIWAVGNNFGNKGPRVLFVGKNARGYKEDVPIDRSLDDSRNGLWNESWAYWSYVRRICEIVYNSDSIENIAFTNLVKCNNSTTVDTTSRKQKQLCIHQVGAFKAEAKIIKPDHIVFMTGWDYDEFIPGIFNCECDLDLSSRKQIGANKVPWAESSVRFEGEIVHVLRTSHPERKRKDEFTSAVANWILSQAPPTSSSLI